MGKSIHAHGVSFVAQANLLIKGCFFFFFFFFFFDFEEIVNLNEKMKKKCKSISGVAVMFDIN